MVVGAIIAAAFYLNALTEHISSAIQQTVERLDWLNGSAGLLLFAIGWIAHSIESARSSAMPARQEATAVSVVAPEVVPASPVEVVAAGEVVQGSGRTNADDWRSMVWVLGAIIAVIVIIAMVVSKYSGR